jgi:hypothetical protein
LPFSVVGILGLLFLLQNRNLFTEIWEHLAFWVLFIGIELTAVGSAYYHLAPNNFRLLWDRLPMTIIFMSFLAIIIGGRISLRAGRWLFGPLLIMGIGSVIYWYLTEVSGGGDLRFYIIIQFLPMIAIPLILFLFPSPYPRTTDLFWVIGWYILAKIFEVLDGQIFALGHFLSGHTFKHLASALAVYWVLQMLKFRRAL